MACVSCDYPGTLLQSVTNLPGRLLNEPRRCRCQIRTAVILLSALPWLSVSKRTYPPSELPVFLSVARSSNDGLCPQPLTLSVLRQQSHAVRSGS